MAYEAKHPNLGNATESATHLLNAPEAGVLKVDHLDALVLAAMQCGLISASSLMATTEDV